MIKTYHDCEKAQEYTLPMVAKVKLPVKLNNNQVQCIQHALKTNQIRCCCHMGSFQKVVIKNLLSYQLPLWQQLTTHTHYWTTHFLIFPMLTETG